MSGDWDPWRHVIVVSSALCMFFCPSFNFSHGVLLVAMTDTGLYDVSTVTWLLSFTNMMHAFGGPVGSALVSLTSCRTAVILSGLAGFLGPTLSSCTSDIRIIFVTYGLLLGIARGITLSATTVSIGYWFKEDSSLASGLTFVGVGVGMLVHPRLVQVLVDEYDVDGALLLMGAIVFHTCICGLLLRPSDFEEERKKKRKIETKMEKDKNYKIRTRLLFLKFKSVILTNHSFLFFVIAVCLFMMAFSVIITFMPQYLNLKGSTPQEAALAASILGSGSLVSRVLAGVMTNDANIGSMIVFSGNCGISSIFTLLLPLMSETVVGRYMYAIAIGIYLTCLFVVLGPTTLKKVGLDNFAYGYGFLLFFVAVVCLIAPPIGVQVKFLTDSYDAVFIFAGCLLMGASLLSFLSELFKNDNPAMENIPESNILLSKTITTSTDDIDGAGIVTASATTTKMHTNCEKTSTDFSDTDV